MVIWLQEYLLETITAATFNQEANIWEIESMLDPLQELLTTQLLWFQALKKLMPRVFMILSWLMCTEPQLLTGQLLTQQVQLLITSLPWPPPPFTLSSLECHRLFTQAILNQRSPALDKLLVHILKYWLKLTLKSSMRKSSIIESKSVKMRSENSEKVWKILRRVKETSPCTNRRLLTWRTTIFRMKSNPRESQDKMKIFTKDSRCQKIRTRI